MKRVSSKAVVQPRKSSKPPALSHKQRAAAANLCVAILPRTLLTGTGLLLLYTREPTANLCVAKRRRTFVSRDTSHRTPKSALSRHPRARNGLRRRRLGGIRQTRPGGH